MRSNLKKALEKLGETPLGDLPNTREDPLWNDIKKELDLSIFQLSALKNHVFPTAPPPAKHPRRAVFEVILIVRGASRSNGARGNVFKLLERHKGFYSKSAGIQISYQDDDLHVKAYFKTEDNAFDFQTAMNQWEIHKELANLEGVEIKRESPQEVDSPGDLQHIVMQDYKPEDSESPRQSLNQLHSYPLSVPDTNNPYLQEEDAHANQNQQPARKGNGHTLMTLPKNSMFDGTKVVFRADKYADKYPQRKCRQCTRRVRTYCSCSPGRILCKSCFPAHVVDVAMENEGDH